MTGTIRGRLSALVLVAVVSVALTGCYPTARNAIADLERFALSLDGVDSVDTLRDTPENMAFPFGGTALGTAAVRLGSDWRESLPEVTTKVHDWIATEQKRDKVDLSVAIVFPFGAIGIADDAAESDKRAGLVDHFADDSNITGVTIGFSPDGSIDTGSGNASIVLARSGAAPVGEILADGSAALTQFATASELTIVVDADLTDSSSATDAQTNRELVVTTDTPASSPVVGWVDAVDANEAITGWRVDEDAAATVYSADTDGLAALDVLLQSYAGFEAISSLTLVTPELTLPSESGDPSVARQLAIAAAAAGVVGVEVSGAGVTADSLDAQSASALLDAGAGIPTVETVLIDATIALGAGSGSACGCIRIGASPFGYLATVLPPLLELDAQSLDYLWVRESTGIDASFVDDDRPAMEAFLRAVHDEAVERGTRVGVSSGAGKAYFIVLFDAAARIDAGDVFSGNNDAPQDQRHADIINFWNSLDI